MTDKEINEVIEDSKYIIEHLDQQILWALETKEHNRKEDEELDISYEIEELVKKEANENETFQKIINKYLQQNPFSTIEQKDFFAVLDNIEDKLESYIDELKENIEEIQEKKKAIVTNLDNISLCDLERIDVETGRRDNSMIECVYNSDCIIKR
jgi:hypothetical protein